MTANAKGIVALGDRTRLIVDNIKCGGCANTISKAMIDLGLSDVTVNHEQSFVEFASPMDAAAVSKAIEKLRTLGYPLVDTKEGLEAIALKAKSYVSCALGKIS